jgi:hypothetical protein
MKKILTIIVSLLILLPVVAFADAWVPSIYYNHTAVVGGTVEESVVFADYDITTFDDITIEYDKDYLSITSKDVQIIVNGEDILTDSSKGSVKVEDGKVIIKVNDLTTTPTHAVDAELGWEGANHIRLKFTALKAGTTTIKAPNKGYSKIAKIKIEENSCPKCVKEDCPKCIDKECPKCPDTYSYNITPEPIEYDNCEGAVGVSIIFMLLLGISAFINLVLFITLIVVLIVKRKPKTN